VFFAKRKLVEKTLERWNSQAIERALARLQAAVLQTRRRPELAPALARQALLGIAIESARLNQRQLVAKAVISRQNTASA
jgi:DNA polymerase-3 subunit delta